MERSIQLRISQYLSEADEYYLKGKYDKCEHTLRLLREEADAAKSLLEVCGMKKCVFSCVLESNILISKGLAFKWDVQDANGTWNDLMHDFSKLQQKVKSLHIVQKAPLKCYLNTVYNGLYWGWWHPNSLQCDKIHVETCMQMAVSCFRKVLEICHDPCPSSSFCNTEDMVLCFMEKVSNNLLNVDGEECLLLLEICGIVIYMLTELQAKREIIIKCISIITFILSMQNQLLLSVRLAFKNKRKEAVTNFKFGPHEVNSAVGKCDFETVLELLKIVCCICYIQTGECAKCVACLEVCEDGTEKLQVISSYLKAYACYHTNETDACLLHLLKLENMAVSTQVKVRSHLLHGSLLTKQGRHLEALQEFFKPLSMGLQDARQKKDFYPVTLYHIAEQYETLHSMSEAHSQSDVKTVQDNRKCSSQQTKSLHASLRADQLDTLQHLVQVLREDEDDTAVDANSIFNFQVKILNILYPQPEINLPVALFKLATALAADGDNSTAGNIFMELLKQPALQPMPSLLTQLPHVIVIYHSTAVLMLKTNQLNQAETLCRQAISYYTSRSYSVRDLEHSLLCLEDDLVALMLLTQVHKLKGEEIKESETLNRCLRLISNYKRSVASVEYSCIQEQTESVNACDADITQLLTALEAKLHLWKAHNYQWRGPAFQNDCFFELKQALLCNPGDKDVGVSYRRFLDENHQYYAHDKSQPPNQCVNLHVDNFSSPALKHLLKSQASDESDVDMFTYL